MIQPNELRIGNLVKCKISNDAGIYRVMAIDGLHLKIYLNEPRNKWHKEEDIKPIPLTEELLVKCGFEYAHPFGFRIKEGCYIKDELERGGYYFRWNGQTLSRILYLHDLQNMIFLLTKKELEINY